MDVIQSKIFLLALMIAAGFIAEKTGYVKGIKDKVSAVILRITLPLLVITSISGQKLDGGLARGAVFTVLAALAIIVLLLATGYITGRLFKYDGKRFAIHVCLSAFGNVIFLGYPLIEGVFGSEGIFFAAFYAMVNDMLVWTLGIYILSKGKGKGDLKRILNPNSISFLIGLLILILGIKPGGIVFDAAAQIGAATMPLSMLFIGATLAGTRLKALISRASVFIIVILKMCLAPFGALWLMRLVGWERWGIPTMVPLIITLQVAMPAQTVLAIVARDVDADIEYAASCIFVTTIFALITLPLVYKIAQSFI